jgi:Phosphotransferase enzyme family
VTEAETAGARRRRAAPEPRAALRAARVASDAAVDGAVLEDCSRSHALTFATLPDGSAWVVKRCSDEAHAAGRSLAAELYAYRLASWRPALASVLPAAVHLDERRQVLVLQAAPAAHLYPAQCLLPGFPGPALAAALGSVLARLHGATAGVPLATVAACGVLALPDAAPEERHLGSESAAAEAVADEVVADAALAPALRAAAARLAPSCLVHADVKWDNAVLDPGPPAAVRLFDLELSGHGDPAWDVACALADTALLPVRLRGAAALPATATAWVGDDGRALLGAYAAGAGAAATGTEFAERVTGCWTGRAVHLALECASAVETPDHPVVRDLLTAARGLASAEDTVVRAVRAGLVAG